MEFEDTDHIICDYFFDEYRHDIFHNWKAFIESKNIGLLYINDGILEHDKYRIIDEKLWMLAKIKYGF